MVGPAQAHPRHAPAIHGLDLEPELRQLRRPLGLGLASALLAFAGGADGERGGAGSEEGRRAGAIELALEGLYLARRLSKESDDGETVYG